MTDLETARECFLSMLADGEWEEQPDGDVNDAGRMIDCTTFKFVVGHRQLAEFCEAIGIKVDRFEETVKDALDRAIATPPIENTATKECSRPEGCVSPSGCDFTCGN